MKCNCARATERRKEAWSISCKAMDKNRIEDAAEQGERAMNREAFVIKAKWRKSGGCAVKECDLTWDLALCLTNPKDAGQPKAGPERSEGCAQRTKGDGGEPDRELSRGRSSSLFGAKGRASGRVEGRVARTCSAFEVRGTGAQCGRVR